MVGVGADEALVAAGAIRQEDYLRALAFSLGLRFGGLDTVLRERCPLSDAMLLAAARVGMLPLSLGLDIVWVVAPSGLRARRLIQMIARNPALRRRVLLTTQQQLIQYVRRRGDTALGRHATDALRSAEPLLSAATRTWRLRAGGAAVASIVAGALFFAPGVTILAMQIAISTLFLAWSGLRIASALHREPEPALAPPLSDNELPVYTILVALYREAAAVPGLVRALSALSYPREKLDIKLVIEADDTETRDALEACREQLAFDVIVAPEAGPRTKPKALNAALPFARGALLVVFDAEDRPERDQLRFAAETFAADAIGDLACVQGRLAIDNTHDGWLPAIFTAEYAGLFDVMLPFLARWRLSIPLGGSSNHFRTDALRHINAWDPYNVTEDADLGMRLDRAGYRVAVIASTTDEEAPAKVGPWLRQRTRWFKGWLQTWCVHMRQPLRTVRGMGLASFTTFQLTVVGSVLAALLQPIAIALIVLVCAFDIPLAPGTAENVPILQGFHIAALASGYAASMHLVFVGLRRRKLSRTGWWLPMMLVHWALLSVASWRALAQFLRDPHRWEKTEHGLARTSRRRGDASPTVAIQRRSSNTSAKAGDDIALTH